MGENERRTLLQVLFERVLVERALAFIRRQNHHDIGPGGCVGGVHDLEASAFCLGNSRRLRTQTDDHIGHAAVLQVVGMGMALAAITDNGNFLALDQAQITVTIVIDAHQKDSSMD